MILTTISDADDARLEDYRDLTDVKLRKVMEPRHGIFMAESHQVIARALSAGYPLRSVLTTPRWLDAVSALDLDDDAIVLVADEALVNQVTGYRVHRGALAAMERVALPSVDDVLAGARRLLALEGIIDHTNVGALFRSAAGLGFDAVLVDPTCADPLYRRAVRVSMGAVFGLPWTRVDDLPDTLGRLARDGYDVLALTPDRDAEPLATLAKTHPDPVVLALGTEGRGLSPQALNAVTCHVRIPMSADVDSLNVAAAAAIACYALGPAGRAG